MNIAWADSASADLQDLHDFIATTAPATATKFINAIIKKVDTIGRFPSLGRMVPEFGRPDLREVCHKNFRIIYHVEAGPDPVDHSRQPRSQSRLVDSTSGRRRYVLRSTNMTVPLQPFSLDRMMQVVENVRERLLRITKALGSSGVPYAVVGGNAVAAWVSRADQGGERNTPNVDILIRREDLGRARAAGEAVGFVYRRVSGRDIFIDGPDGRERQAVHLLFDGESFQPDAPLSNPKVDESEAVGEFRVISLTALVQMKLIAFRAIDATHLRDMIDVGLIDATWYDRFPTLLAERLRSVIETPEG